MYVLVEFHTHPPWEGGRLAAGLAGKQAGSQAGSQAGRQALKVMFAILMSQYYRSLCV